MELLDELFSEEKSKALDKLAQDDSQKIRLSVARHVGKTLQEQGLVLAPSTEQLFALMSMANFADSDLECVYVAGVIRHLLPRKDILPYAIDHKGYELASRCLVSLGLFYKAMERRTKKQGAPEPSFYREIGKSTFSQIGAQDVSNNFERWEGFMSEVFA